MTTKKTEHNFVLTAKDNTKKTIKSVGGGFSSLGDKANNLGSKVGGIAGKFAVVGAAAAAALTVVTVKSFESADALGKFSDRIGISTQALAGLRHAANQTAGVADKQLDTALQRMTRRVSQAASGTGEAVKVLGELNLNAAALNKLAPDQQFAAIADAMKNVDDQGDKVRLTFGLFDSEGVGLVNTLDQGSAGLAQFADEADKLGLALDRGSIAKIEVANDAFDKLKKSSVGVGNAIAVGLAPTLTGMANLWIENVAKTTDWGKVTQTTVNFAVKGTAMVADGLQGVVTVLQFSKVGALSLAKAFADLFANSTQAAATFLNFFGTGLKALVIGSLELVRKLGEALAMLPGSAGRAGESLIENISGMQNAIDDALTFDGDKVAAGIKGVGAAYENALADLDNAVNAPRWSDKVNELHQSWELSATEAAAKVKNAVSSVYNLDDVTGSSPSAAETQTLASLTRKLDSVTTFLQTEEQRTVQSYANRQITLENSLAAGLISEQTYANQTAALEQKKQDELTKIAAKGATDRQKFAAMSFGQQAKQVVGFLSQNTQALAKESKTWFNVNKGLSIANAAMSTFEAVTKTLASYPAPLNFGLAAVVAANGLAQINGIRKQSFNAGGNSSVSTPSITAGSTSNPPITAPDVDINSPLAQPAASGGGMTVIFAGDVTGFDKDEVADAVIEKFSDKINNDDLTFIERDSRFVQDLKEYVA